MSGFYVCTFAYVTQADEARETRSDAMRAPSAARAACAMRAYGIDAWAVPASKGEENTALRRFVKEKV